MSRAYKLSVEAIGITEEQLNEVMKDQFGWKGDTDSYKEKTYFHGDGHLHAGRSEEEAHSQIYKVLKVINPNARIKTQWTYMDDLPFESYGDDLD